jgi:hypothetical protein
MTDDSRRGEGTQQEREPVRIIGPVGQPVRLPGVGIVMVPCPYGSVGGQCRSCPLTTDLPCVVREMIGANDETTRTLVRRLLGGR